MKISEYPLIQSFNSDDHLLVDGTAGGTRRISAVYSVLSGLALNSHHVKRTIPRGMNLGASLTVAQKSAIQAGTFDDLWLGDYWEIGGIKYRIADFDYWYGRGDSKFLKHHLNIVPDIGLANSKMNATNATTGAYLNCVGRTTGLTGVKTTISNAFGDAVLSHREFLTNAVTSGYPSAGEWTNVTVELMNELMLFGSHINTPANNGSTDVKRYTVSATQLALFRVAPDFIVSEGGTWLRDVVSGTDFACLDEYGAAASDGASIEHPLRPVFAIG